MGVVMLFHLKQRTLITLKLQEKVVSNSRLPILITSGILFFFPLFWESDVLVTLRGG